jgi:hypothetical protein
MALLVLLMAAGAGAQPTLGQGGGLWSSGGTCTIGPTACLPFGGNGSLCSPTANALEWSNGTNIASFSVFKTYTNASNYEKLQIYTVGNTFTIAPLAAGTGVVQNLTLAAPYVQILGSLGPSNSTTPNGTYLAMWKDTWLGWSIQGGKAKSLTDAAAAVTVINVSIPASGKGALYAQGKVLWSAMTTDATEYQVTGGEFRYSGVNKGGAMTCAAPEVIDADLPANSSGTLTCTWSAAGAATSCNLLATCTSDLAGVQTITVTARVDTTLNNVITYP